MGADKPIDDGNDGGNHYAGTGSAGQIGQITEWEILRIPSARAGMVVHQRRGTGWRRTSCCCRRGRRESEAMVGVLHGRGARRQREESKKRRALFS